MVTFRVQSNLEVEIQFVKKYDENYLVKFVSKGGEFDPDLGGSLSSQETYYGWFKHFHKAPGDKATIRADRNYVIKEMEASDGSTIKLKYLV